MSETDVLATLEFLAAQYGQEPNEAQAAFWLEALGDCDPDILRSAAVQHVRTCKWFPKLSEIIDLADNQKQVIEDADKDRRAYWSAMGAYNDDLAGRTAPGELERSQAYRWYQRHASAAVDGDYPERDPAVVC